RSASAGWSPPTRSSPFAPDAPHGGVLAACSSLMERRAAVDILRGEYVVRVSAEASGLLEHLGRLGQHRGRDRQAQGLGRLLVDEKGELGRLLDGEVAGLGPLEPLVHEGGGAPQHGCWVAA